MCNYNLFKGWRHLHYRRNNSQRQPNMDNLTQTLENLLLQNLYTEFLDIAQKQFLCMSI